MDLKRSMDFMEVEDKEIIRRILLNIAAEYPPLTYYQGMNYIAIFLYKAFGKDAKKAFHFLCYMADYCLIKYFGNNFQGTLKLIFVVDKLLEKVYPSIWAKLFRGHVSAIHFTIPNFITLFTSMIKSPDTLPYIYDIWDCLLGKGIPCLVNSLLLMLEVQQSQLFKIPSDQLLLVMKNVEKDPFAIVKSAGVSDMKAYYEGLSKKAIVGVAVGRADIYRLEEMFEKVRQLIQTNWEN